MRTVRLTGTTAPILYQTGTHLIWLPASFGDYVIKIPQQGEFAVFGTRVIKAGMDRTATHPPTPTIMLM
jgi:hypothetical protein